MGLKYVIMESKSVRFKKLVKILYVRLKKNVRLVNNYVRLMNTEKMCVLMVKKSVVTPRFADSRSALQKQYVKLEIMMMKFVMRLKLA
jgi:hypothetical protein